jgi:peptide/nickel transport system ATP-binding protein
MRRSGRTPLTTPEPTTVCEPEVTAELRELQVRFTRGGQAVHALRGVDLRISRGEILGLVGESGSGKSVLGLSLLGLLPAQAKVQGQALVGGVDMVSADAKVRRRVQRNALGAVFQDPMTSLNPTMRIGRQLAEVTQSTEESRRLLTAVGVPDARERLDAYPHELSGGLRQRVMLAMAVAGDPHLIIADEPTTALDVTLQAQVLNMFRRLRDDVGCAVLLITHDLAVAATIADRICVLYGGRIAEVGAAAPVTTTPAHPYTASLMTSRIAMDADSAVQLPTIAGEPPDPAGEPPGCSFQPRCPAAAAKCATHRPLLLPVPRHDGLAACHFNAGPDVERRTPPGWETQQRRTGGARMRDVVVRFGSRGLRGRGGSFEALRGVSLDLSPGESLALVGESGSGKTTVLRVLAGRLRPSTGQVEVLGSKGPQMVFQDAGASLTPWLTVGELLSERLRDQPAATRRARIGDLLGYLGLPEEVVRVRPQELSGGQRQRIALARAVIDPPDLLLCDEPTSALDASLAATVLNLIGQLRRELGFSMVFVTHDLAAARLVADRIAVMTGGRIVETGATNDVVSRPAQEYTRSLIAAVPR